jgi:hypothetical protein
MVKYNFCLTSSAMKAQGILKRHKTYFSAYRLYYRTDLLITPIHTCRLTCTIYGQRYCHM